MRSLTLWYVTNLSQLVKLAEELVEGCHEVVGRQRLGEGCEVDNVGVQYAHVIVSLN